MLRILEVGELHALNRILDDEIALARLIPRVRTRVVSHQTNRVRDRLNRRNRNATIHASVGAGVDQVHLGERLGGTDPRHAVWSPLDEALAEDLDSLAKLPHPH